ncbi:MAG: DUF4159 domain-containing protein [Bacteroidota bacterium]
MLRSSFTIFLLVTALLFLISPPALAQSKSSDIEIARIKYRGGGDWYNDPSSLRNLLRFSAEQVPLGISNRYSDIDIGSPELFKHPFAFLTGHGTIATNASERRNLRQYLENGGFLYVDDDYGLDTSFRELIKETFPDESLVELPYEHPLFHQVFQFPNGVPKIHEHDNKAPQTFGLFIKGRLALVYTYESNLADGWADPSIHNTPQNKRLQSLQMGTNLLIYALNGNPSL